MQQELLSSKLKTPLYKQLKVSLRKYIEENLVEGDVLPIEPEIEKMYGVSRITVRRTIDELVTDGVVKKIQGRSCIERWRQVYYCTLYKVFPLYFYPIFL